MKFTMDIEDKEVKTEKYPISYDIALLNDKAKAADTIVKLAMKLPFGYRKAHKAATDSIRFDRLFWKKVRDVYPQFDNKTIGYHAYSQSIYEVTKDFKAEE